MRTRVKICGITRWEDAQLAVELGADALGFNFYPRSPRYIEPSAARAIAVKLPPLVAAVGVFADESDEVSVASVARQARMSVVQVHGPRYPSVDGALAEFTVIRAMAVDEAFQVEDLQKLSGSAFLLDAHDPRLLGGTGKTFNWKKAHEASRYGTIILAGGLTPQNVAEAIAEVRPFAVDVASGVEASPGKKNEKKMRAFFAAVDEADRSL